MPFALDAVRDDAKLANGRDFIIEPNLDDCEGCHVVIEENREAFHSDHEVSPIFAEMQSDFAWAENVESILLTLSSRREEPTRPQWNINSKIPWTFWRRQRSLKPRWQTSASPVGIL